MNTRNIRCIKFFLTLFNTISTVVALILVAICVINIRENKIHPQPQSPFSRGILSFLVTLGIFLIVAAILGCVGALREHIKVLYAHACFFIFLVSIELVVGVGGAVLSAWVGGRSDLRVQFYKNATVEDGSLRQYAVWDNLQSENNCCGVDGPQDYAILNRDIPASCCARAYSLREGGARRHLHATCIAEKAYYTRGCEEALRDKKALKGNILIATGIVFTLLEMLCIILAFWLAKTIRTERLKLQQNLQAHFET